MKKFNEIYKEVYDDFSKPLEQMRKKSRSEILIVSSIAIVLGLVISIITKTLIFMMLSVIIIILYMVLSKSGKKYKKFFKENVVSKFVKEYSEELGYSPERGISAETYQEGQFESYDRYHSEDLIHGTLEGGYKINMAEVHTEDESTDQDGHTTYVTIFYGLFAEVEFDKYISTNIKIRKNAWSIFKKNKIEMDSGEFEKIYNVYSDDKIVTMQLLTSDIMQMFIDFKERYKIAPEITLYNNKMYIRFRTGDMFEAKIIKKALDYETLKKYYDTINFTLGITEKFLKNIKETEI